MDMGLPASRFAIQQFGKMNGEAIVLIHGNGLTSETFHPLLQKLGEQFRLITYDQRGFGKTTYDGVNFSISAMSADLENIVNSLNLTKFHLVAHSFGARIAVDYASMHPERVLSLSIEDMEMQARQLTDDKFCRQLGLEMKALNRIYSSKDSLEDEVGAYYAGDAYSLSLLQVEPLSNGWVRLRSNPFQAYIWGCFADSRDLRVSFSSIKSPILILRADPVFSAISEAGLKQMIHLQPSAKVVNFPGSHHLIHRFDTDAFVEALKAVIP